MDGLLASFPPLLRRRFVPLGRLGAGGMGEVLRVHDRLLDRAVALKLVAGGRGLAGARLAAEFGVLSQLDHPGVVRVHEVGRAADGAAWMVSEQVAGQRLDHWLADAAPEALAPLVADLLATLAFLHGHGLVHGDLKPANVLVIALDSRPWPVLIDFGLAVDFGAGPLLGGTRAYLAPELLRRAAPGVRTDLYALGRSIEPAVRRDPGLGRLVAALTADAPEARPRDAEAALELLDGPHARRLGARGHASLWPDEALTTVADALAASPGHHAVHLPADADAEGFAAALKAALDLAGEPSWIIPADDAFGRLGRALTCLLPNHVAPTIRGAGPDDHKAALDALADAVITRLGGGDAEAPPILLLPEPAHAVEAARYLVARLAEADALPRVCVVHGPSGGAPLGRGVDATMRIHEVPAPGAADIVRFLSRHGIDGPFPPAALTLLEARAAAGAGPLRAQLLVWHRGGALTAAADGRWRLTGDGDGDGDGDGLWADAPDLDGLWAALWARLEPLAREALGHLHELGGGAPLSALETLCPGGLREILAELLPAGWLRLAPDAVLLAPEVDRRVASGALPHPAPSHDDRQRYAVVLAAAPAEDLRSAAALARQEEALSAWEDAAITWRRAADLHARRYAPADAGAALLRAVRCAERSGAHDDALQAAALAARLLDAGGDLTRLAEAAAAAREAGERIGTRQARVTARLVEARAAIRVADSPAALAALADVAPAGLSPEQAFDLTLARGTALAQAGRRDEAARALDDATDRAEQLDDLHGLGRVANNLGIVDYQRGDVAAAARAWERSADAKAKTGDLRGQRIAQSNRALALRELGRLPEAHAASLAAAALATRIGDRGGQAMGRLALAQLWLDLGAATPATTTLDEFERVPATSALMRGDAAILRARTMLAEGRYKMAALRAAQTVMASRATGLATVAAEAWTVAYAAAARAGEPLGWQTSKVLGSDPAETAAALVASGDAPADAALACLAHAEARAGRWDASRAHLAELLARLDVEVPKPAATPALDLAARAARVLGDHAALARLDALASRVVTARREAAEVLLGAEAPDASRLAVALGLRPHGDGAQFLLDSERPRATASPQERTTLSATESLLLRTWDALPPRAVARPEAWAEAVHAATGAASCELLRYDEDDTHVAARTGGGDEPARFLELARGLRAEAAPFVADGALGDGVEAVGVPLVVADDEPPVGSLFIAFDGARGPRDLERSLVPTIAGAALAVALDRARRAEERATSEVARLVATREAEAKAHRDEITALRDALELSQSELGLRYDYDALVHTSPAFRRVLGMLDKVTDNDLPVLVTGESGVGKELLARALHFNGPRHGGHFVAENCGAIPGDLFESVFFGHVRGAFTGAHSARRGLLEMADGGTLFLDEVGELPLEHQVKLLRALQEKRFRPVGSQKELASDFRVVAATNRDLAAMVADGSFREDLFYRIAVVTIDVPPLRDRRDDVLPIVQRLLEERGARTGRELKLTTGAADALIAYPWPGNVRELENELLRAAVLCEGTHIRAAHLSPRVLAAATGTSPSDAGAGTLSLAEGETLADVLSRVETQVLAATLKQTAGKKAPAARRLGLSRPGLDAKIERHGIDIQRIKVDAKRRGRGEGRG